MKIIKNKRLAEQTTFHIGGPAKYFLEATNIQNIKEGVDFANKNKLKIFILGGGSNILLPDKGINGLVIKISLKGIEFKDSGEHTTISANAGESWDKIVAQAVKKGLSGIENLSLVPGTVGGAVCQNIGAYGIELKDVLESAEVFDVKTGEIIKLGNKACSFGYRTSIFKNLAGRYIVLRANIKLTKKYIPNLTYSDLIKYFEKRIPTLTETRKAVIKIRRSKLVYPTKEIGTVGSFFKNPVITDAEFKKLSFKYPDIKGRESGNGKIKLFAGQLTEKAGWKGKELGNAGVSAKHAMVLVSYKNTRAEDILKLSKAIQKSVKSKFGITLEPEAEIIR